MLRRTFVGLAVILVLLVMAGAAGLWWLGTESGLRFAIPRLQQAVTAQGGELLVDDVSGSLYRGIRIGDLSWRSSDGMEVEGSDLSMRWLPPALLRRQLHVPELGAARLTVRLAPAKLPSPPRKRMEMPGVFALPLSVVLERLGVDELRIVPAPAADGSARGPVVVTDVAGRLSYRDGSLSVTDLGALTPWGRIADARFEIADQPPHPLQATLRWGGEVALLPFDLEVGAAGDLDAVQVDVAGTAADARIAVAARLAPLEAMPLVSAQADMANLDLRGLHDSAPRTMIDAKLSLASVTAAGWNGAIALRNLESGGLQEGKLPLLALDTRLLLAYPTDPAKRRLQFQDLLLTLPAHAAIARDNSADVRNAEARISGSIDVQPGRMLAVAGAAIPAVQAVLVFSAIDLSRFGAQLPATALDGKLAVQDSAFTLHLAQSAERMRVLLPSSLAEAAGAAEVAVRGRLDESLLHLEEARLRLGRTRLSASGRAGLSAPHRIAFKGDAHDVELVRWLTAEGIEPRFREGHITGAWSIDGTAVPGLDAWLTVVLADSTLAGMPLGADLRGRLVLSEQWVPARLEGASLDVRLGENRARAGGALGKPGGQLTISLSLPEPHLLDPRLTGRVALTGEINGPFDRLRARLVLNGERLAFGAGDSDRVHAASISINAAGPVSRLTSGSASRPTAEEAIDLSVHLRGLQAGGHKADSIELAVKGRLADHRIDLKARASGNSLRMNGTARATLSGEPSWQARLMAATLDGAIPIRLTSPADVRIDRKVLRLDNLAFAVAGGNASIEHLLLRRGATTVIETQGTARNLPVSRLLSLADANPVLDAVQSVSLEADWNLRGSGAEDLNGTARVAFHERAAVRAAGTGRLGLTDENGVNLTFRHGQLDGRFDLRLPSLAFTHPLTAPDLILDGRLRLAGSVDGSVTQPQWHATLSGENLSVLQRSVGWRLGKGSLAARFDGRKVQLQALEFSSGEGSMTLRGEASLLDAPRANRAPVLSRAGVEARAGTASVLPIAGRFELTASAFEVPLGPGQRLAVSGVTRVESASEGLSLRGNLRADHGIIEIQGSAAPSLPDDVKLVDIGPEGKRIVDTRGRTVAKNGVAVEPEVPDNRLRILTDLAVDLGDRLRVTGNGVAARVGGSLQVLGTLPDQPRLLGTVNIVEGSYQAYGQNLRIERGAAARFNGPADNPALDVTAKRPFLPVEVGVSITGTLLNPVITLVSTPDMSDTDKLSWLVLGTGPGNAISAAQSLALREAARSLFLGGDGRHRRGLAARLGLDVVNFGYGSDVGPMQGITERRSPTGLPGAQSSSTASLTQQEVIMLGKQIGSRLFVSYEQGVRGLYNLLRIQYSLSRRLMLRAQSGSENALDLLFSYSSD